MAFIATKNKDGSFDMTFEGVHYVEIFTMLLKAVCYKLCYLYGLTYGEVLSMYHSMNKRDLMKIYRLQLPKTDKR